MRVGDLESLRLFHPAEAALDLKLSVHLLVLIHLVWVDKLLGIWRRARNGCLLALMLISGAR